MEIIAIYIGHVRYQYSVNSYTFIEYRPIVYYAWSRNVAYLRLLQGKGRYTTTFDVMNLATLIQRSLSSAGSWLAVTASGPRAHGTRVTSGVSGYRPPSAATFTPTRLHLKGKVTFRSVLATRGRRHVTLCPVLCLSSHYIGLGIRKETSVIWW